MHLLLCPPLMSMVLQGFRLFIWGSDQIWPLSEHVLGHLSHSDNIIPLVMYCSLTIYIRLWYLGDPSRSVGLLFKSTLQSAKRDGALKKYV